MKKFGLLLTVFIFFFMFLQSDYVFGQTINGTTYPFSNSSGTVLEVPTGATQLIGSGADNVASSVSGIGFDFWFNGIRYTQFSVNENGLMKLGSSVITTESVNSLASTANLPKIAPYWDDLSTGTNGKVQYWITGTAPNRKLVVQWNVTVPKVLTNPANATFQVWLFETTGVIEFVYGSGIITNSNNYSVGIGSSSSVFASVNSSYPYVTYGVANDLNTSSILSGMNYKFTPVIPAAPSSLSFTGVSVQSMTLNWFNNAVNSVGNVVYSSVDNITYNYLTQLPASATSYTAAGLIPGTTYHWKVFAISEGGMSTALADSQTTNSTTMSGTYSVGPTGNYASLTSAISAIQSGGLSGPVILELQSAYLSSVETFPIRLPVLTTSAVNTLTIRPASDATGLVIGTSADSLVFLFDGASYVTIDGRLGGTGSTKDLTIRNTFATSTGTIQFQNDASYNLLEYCNISGVTTSLTGGIIKITSTTGTTGNNNNTIDNCSIFDAGVSGVSNGIYALGSSTVGLENKQITISNCNIYNFHVNYTDQFSYASGVNVGTGNLNWTISNNNFYQTVSRVTGGGWQYGIYVTGGTNHSITGNYIGGTAPAAGGSAWITSGTNSGAFKGIYVNVTAVSNNSITNNTISNLNLSYTLSGNQSANQNPFTGIHVASGNAIITGNVIGSGTMTGSILTYSTYLTSNGLYGGASYGINGYSSYPTGGSISISNNVVGGIITSSPTTSNHSFFGIVTGSLYSTAVFTISNNTVGSTTTANSIVLNPTTFASAQNLAGITNSSGGSVTISSNTIANLTNRYSGATLSYTRGILSTIGINSITGNTVYNLSYSVAGSSGASSPVTGIYVTPTGAGQVISQNTVYSLIDSVATGATGVIGIYSGAASGTYTIAKNFVHSLSLITNSTTSTIIGMMSAAGTSTFSNNLVRLGIKADGSFLTTGYFIYGMYESGGTSDKYYFNSVYIGGTGVTAGSNTFAFYRANTSACDARDNIFYNARANSAATLTNYILQITSLTGLTLNYNIYYNSGSPSASFGLVGATNYSAFASWKAANTALDINSGFADPNYVLPAGTAATLDMHVQSPTAIEGNGIDISTITDDYFGNTRSGLTPVDIGANAGTFTANDITAPVITYTAFSNTGSTSNRILTAIITDQSGVPTADVLQPRIYFKKGAGGTWFSTQGVLSSGTGTNGTWSFTIDYSLLGGVIVNDVVYYYVIAQDIVGTPNISSLPAGVLAVNVNSVTTPPSTPNSYTILNGLSGTVTVGSGGTYSSLTLTGGLFTSLNAGVLSGNLTVNIISDLTSETGAVTLNQIRNDGTGSYTVTINPVGARVISGISGATGLINLNGASGVIIDGLNTGGNSLTISNTNVTNTLYPAILFTAGASNNIITNTTITGNATSGPVISFAPSSGTGCNNNTISNCIITNGTLYPAYGISFSGSYNPMGANNIITNNKITNFSSAGINSGSFYNGALTISNNEIYHTVPAGTTLNGIYISNYSGGGTITIMNNKIHDLNPASPTAANTITGITYFQGYNADILNIYNNQIVLDASVSNTAATVYGINMSGWGTCNVYYNSIYIGGSGITSGSSAGLARVNNYPGTSRVMNNAVFNARSGGTGYHYGFNYQYGTITSNNNDLYANGTGSYLGYYFGTNYLALSSFVSATGKDSLSYSGDPGFTSTTNLLPDTANPNSFILNGTGAPISTINKDFNGISRSTAVSSGPTDIGAYEFTPTAIPNAAVQLGTIQVGNKTAYFIAGKQVGTIEWTGGTSLPGSVTFKYWSGFKPSGAPDTAIGSGYYEISQSGGSNFTFNLSLNYSPVSINTISAENKITLTKKTDTLWAHVPSVLDLTAKTISLSAQNSFTLYALADKTNDPVIPTFVRVNVKALLQGPYSANTDTMRTNLRTKNLIPLNSEAAYDSTAYGYTPKVVSSIPGYNIIDWVILDLRTGTNALSKVSTKAAFITNNGTIVDTDGVSPVTFNSVSPGSFYIVVRHRNHLPVMSANPVALDTSSSLYDFTTGQSQAYGTNPMDTLNTAGTLFGLIAGMNDGNSTITTNDYNGVTFNLFLTSYLAADHDLSGTVTAADYNKVGINLFRTSQVPEVTPLKKRSLTITNVKGF